MAESQRESLIRSVDRSLAADPEFGNPQPILQIVEERYHFGLELFAAWLPAVAELLSVVPGWAAGMRKEFFFDPLVQFCLARGQQRRGDGVGAPVQTADGGPRAGRRNALRSPPKWKTEGVDNPSALLTITVTDSDSPEEPHAGAVQGTSLAEALFTGVPSVPRLADHAKPSVLPWGSFASTRSVKRQPGDSEKEVDSTSGGCGGVVEGETCRRVMDTSAVSPAERVTPGAWPAYSFVPSVPKASAVKVRSPPAEMPAIVPPRSRPPAPGTGCARSPGPAP